MIFKENVMTGNIGWCLCRTDPDCRNIPILGNVVIGVAQLPSVLASLYAWTRPVSGFTIESHDVIIKDNICAGCVDQGFAIATSFSSLPTTIFVECAKDWSISATHWRLITMESLSITRKWRKGWVDGNGNAAR